VRSRVADALARVDRARYVPEDLRVRAWEDVALPIGHEQTISQPTMVRLICEALDLQGDERVLDVGTGSGYQAAVLAEVAREVYSIERIPELAEQARRTLAEAGYENVHVHVGDGTLGLPAYAPYDGVAVAAAAPDVPRPLWEQLREGGRIVVPIGDLRIQELRVIERTAAGPRLLESVPARFVPLLGEEGHA
jgi:protein-L-isoaspartate(D-aspartate) O-methyltransferase